MHGVKGAGKTQVVLRYTQKHSREYDSIGYLDASSELVFIASLFQFYDYLRADKSEHDFSVLRTFPSVTDFATKACHELLNKEQLLIIFDSIDTSSGDYLTSYLPKHMELCRAHRIFVAEEPSHHLGSKTFGESISLPKLDSAGILRLMLANMAKSVEPPNSADDNAVEDIRATISGIELYPIEAILLSKSAGLRENGSSQPDNLTSHQKLSGVIGMIFGSGIPASIAPSVGSKIWKAAHDHLSPEARDLLRILVAMQTPKLSVDM